MKILLINPPIRTHVKADVIPLGIAYIASSLIAEGHSVRILDINAYRWEKSEVIKKIAEIDFDVVGIGGLITVYSYFKWLTLELKKRYPNIPIVAGGSVATPIPDLILSNTGVDIICYGEADLTVKELLPKLKNGSDLREIQGIIFKDNEEIIYTSPRPLVKNLDDIPLPAYHLLPMDIYIENVPDRYLVKYTDLNNIPIESIGNRRIFSLISGRGCLYNCSFCYKGFRGMRQNSVDYMINHIKFLMNGYGINTFCFVDELFTANKKWINNFCDTLVSERLPILFRAWSRSDHIDRDLLHKMKEAGCYNIGFGLESGSQIMLDAMNKKTNVDRNREAIRLTREVGVTAVPTFIVGMPGETKKTILETVKLIKETGIDDGGVFFATPYPGTRIYEYAKKRGLIDDEEDFIEQLDDASKFVINLTDNSNNTLKYFRFKVTYAILANSIKGKKAIDAFWFAIRKWLMGFLVRLGMKDYIKQVCDFVGVK